MGHILRITDGTTTLTLTPVTSGTPNYMYLLEYVPQTNANLMDETPIKEKATVGFFNSISDIQSNLRILDRLLRQAANYSLYKSGLRVYVEFDPGTSGTVYRSLLFGGAQHAPQNILGEAWGSIHIEFDIEWTRQAFWEGPLTQLPLTNASATNDTAGINVDNSNYGSVTTQNWVSIAAADVLGDLPCPVKIQMVNAKSGAGPSDEFYIWHNVDATPASLIHILEGEDASGSTVTDDTDASCSGGSYAKLEWPDNQETLLATFALTTANLSYCSGERFAILARWNGLFPYNDCWLRVKLEETAVGTYDVFTGAPKLASAIVSGRELGILETLQLPPYLPNRSGVRALSLRLYGQRDGTDHEIDLDYIQLCPISSGGGWLRLKGATRGVGYTESLVYDGTEDECFRIDSGAKKSGDFGQYGGPILLTPNAAQKLYFNTGDYQGYADINQNWTVKVWYRPRRSSI